MTGFCCIGRDGLPISPTCLLCTKGNDDLTVATGFCSTITEVRLAGLTNFGRVKEDDGASCWIWSVIDPKGGSVGTGVKVGGGLLYWLCSGPDPFFPSQLVHKGEEVGSSSSEGDIYGLGSTLCFKVRSSFSLCLPILRKISMTLFADPELPLWCPCCRSLYASANLRLFCSALGCSPRPCWGGEL